jgi:hypothetical protein
MFDPSADRSTGLAVAKDAALASSIAAILDRDAEAAVREGRRTPECTDHHGDGSTLKIPHFDGVCVL